jgi:hypothetical protein
LFSSVVFLVFSSFVTLNQVRDASRQVLVALLSTTLKDALEVSALDYLPPFDGGNERQYVLCIANNCCIDKPLFEANVANRNGSETALIARRLYQLGDTLFAIGATQPQALHIAHRALVKCCVCC